MFLAEKILSQGNYYVYYGLVKGQYIKTSGNMEDQVVPGPEGAYRVNISQEAKDLQAKEGDPSKKDETEQTEKSSSRGSSSGDRERVKALCRTFDIEYKFYCLIADKTVRLNRVIGRNKGVGDTFEFPVSPEMFEITNRMFEMPSDSELEYTNYVKTSYKT